MNSVRITSFYFILGKSEDFNNFGVWWDELSTEGVVQGWVLDEWQIETALLSMWCIGIVGFCIMPAW